MFRIFLSIFLIFNVWIGFSQPCDDPVSPSNLCKDAPILCNLDGYCSNNALAENSGTPDAFCGQVENNSWLAFIAGSTKLSIEISVSNCKDNYGLQAQFFSTNDYIHFKAESDCLDPILNKGIITANALVKGKRYYLMMDGKAGDVCDYSYKVISGYTFSPAAAKIKTPKTLCENESILLETEVNFLNADLTYHWSTTDGHIISKSEFSYIEIDQAGTYKVVITDISGCSDSTEINIKMQPAPVVMIDTPPQLNCKSNKMITLSANSDGLTNTYFWTTIEGRILSGENSSNPVIDKPGIYQVVVTNPDFGCQTTSMIEVMANQDTPIAKIEGNHELNCNNSTLELNGSASTLGTNINYQWTTDEGHFISSQQDKIAIIDQPGIYTFEVTNLESECSDSKSITITLNDRKPEGASISTFQPCFQEKTGVIQIDNIYGGTLPYEYAFDSAGFQTISYKKDLVPDNYKVIIRDATGCEWDTIIQIVEQPEMKIELGLDQTVELGESIDINLEINFPKSSIENIIWTPSFECDTCLEHSFTPFKSQEYKVHIIDKNGCEAEDEIQVSVIEQRNIFIPNAFSPNNDGINDVFYIFGGIAVKSVLSFEIFDRWGNKVSSFYNFQPNQPSFGWNGLIRGKKADQGIYAYSASIVFIDGEILHFMGNLSLMK